MINKKVIKITIIGAVIVGLLISVAFIFFCRQSLEKIFVFSMEKHVKGLCPDCNTYVSDFNITSYSPSNFQFTTNLEVRVKQNNLPILLAPRIKLNLNLLKIFSEFKIPIKINTHSAKLNLDIADQKNIDSRAIIKLLGALNKRRLLVTDSIEIENSHITMDKVPYLFDFKKTTANDLSSSSSIKITSNHFESKIEILSNKIGKYTATKYKIYNFPAKFIIGSIPNKFQNDFLSQINKSLFLSGILETKFGSNTRILNAKFFDQIQNQKSQPNIIKFLLSLSSKDWNDRINIEDFHLSLPNESELIYAKGYLRNYSKMLQHKASLLLSFKAKKLDLNLINSLWPKMISSDAKSWMNDSFKKAKLTNLKGEIYIKDILSGGSNNVSISGDAGFQISSLKYMPEFPQIDGLSGLINFTNSTIIFNIHEGKMIDSSIKRGSLVKINLKDNEVPLTINVNAHGPLENFIYFIDKEKLLQLETKKIVLKNVYGVVDASVDIKIPLVKEICLNNLGLNVNADLKDVKFSVFDKFTLQGPLKLNINNYLLSITGIPLINDNKSKFKWQTHLKDQMEFDHKLKVATILDASEKNLSLFYDKIRISKGKAVLDAQYICKNQDEKIVINSNLDSPNVYFHDIDITKNSNKKSNFNLVLVNTKEQGWKTQQCDFVSDEENIKISSYLELSDDLEEVKKLDSIIESSDNNAKINILLNKKEGKFFIDADRITLSKDHLVQLLNSQSFSKDQKVSVQVKINKAIMKRGIMFENITGVFKCYKNVCTTNTLSMKINDKKKPNSTLRIYKNNKAIVLRTNNAAALLRGFDIYDNIEGGHMTVTLRTPTKHNLQKTPLSGSIYVKDFRAVKTSILAKLILMTPFTQIVEQLKGKNLIYFKEFQGSFVIANNVLKLRQSRATGDLIAVTLSGNIDLNKQMLNLEGELIPRCFLNEFMSKIQNKQKRDSEKYLLATHYKISGNLNDPKIYITPISILVSLFTKPLSII